MTLVAQHLGDGLDPTPTGEAASAAASTLPTALRSKAPAGEDQGVSMSDVPQVSNQFAPVDAWTSALDGAMMGRFFGRVPAIHAWRRLEVRHGHAQGGRQSVARCRL